MKFRAAAALLLASLGGPLPLRAQTSAPPPTPAPASPAAQDAVAYRIGAGDVLSVTVADFPTNSTPQAVVAPDGTVSLSLIGTLPVAGLTVEQVTAQVTRKLRKYIVSPSVTVTLVQKHVQTVVVTGSIVRGGTFDFRPGLHLLDALAQAGGPLPTADAPHSVLTHADGTSQKFDLSHPEINNGPDVNVPLRPGDVVYVPEQLAKVSIVGDVKQPGSIPYRENLTVLDLIAAGGGPDMQTADLRSAKLVRGAQTIPLDLDGLLRRGVLTANVRLSPGDQLVVPEWNNRTYVYGSVEHPGWFYYKYGDHVVDALQTAGVTPQADLGKINVIHTNKDKSFARMDRVNLTEFLFKGNIAGNPPIAPGDSLYIPDKHHAASLGDILTPLYAANALTNISNSVRR